MRLYGLEELSAKARKAARDLTPRSPAEKLTQNQLQGLQNDLMAELYDDKLEYHGLVYIADARDRMAAEPGKWLYVVP
ncbi:hypothetical protein WDZ92_20295 [Nostoc sp. NIES-2111]